MYRNTGNVMKMHIITLKEVSVDLDMRINMFVLSRRTKIGHAS